MTAAQHARLRRAAAAFAVLLLHAGALRILIASHVFLFPQPDNPIRMTWIVLPPEEKFAPPILSSPYAMAPL